jgi:epoxyqueuosine reductase
MPYVEEQVKREARNLGFELVGIAPATEADGLDRLGDWLARGFAGEMAYMHRHAAARRHPAAILPQVRSVVMVGMNYRPQTPEPGPATRGKVARYARGADYHRVIRGKLKELLRRIQKTLPDCAGRAVVDTAPLLERDFARRAGLGWFGKNTMLLNKRLGSYFFIGALLLDQQLTPDAPHEANHCGTCTACLDACPTSAFAEPGMLDSRRCISYLTIEMRGPVPHELRPGIGDWVFGCDVCQEVCPWNRKAPPGQELGFIARPYLETFDAAEVLNMSEEDFRGRFQGTALMRAGRTGVLRNAAIVLGNRGDRAALAPLRQALHDSDAVVREAAAWAIARIISRSDCDDVAADAAADGPMNRVVG